MNYNNKAAVTVIGERRGGPRPKIEINGPDTLLGFPIKYVEEISPAMTPEERQAIADAISTNRTRLADIPVVNNKPKRKGRRNA